MFNVKHAMPNHVSAPDDDHRVCDYEDSTYRTDFWEGRGRDYEDGAERVAIRRLLPRTGTRLLDIGAGFGRLADLYAGYREVILLDYSVSQLRYARERLGDERFLYVAADIYHLPLADNAVDTTIMVRVLHHLVDVPLAFRHIARATAGQGTFVLEFANKRHLKNLIRYALHRGANPFAHEPYAFADLHYDFHPAWVSERLRDAGMSPERRLSVSLFRLAALKRHVPASVLIALDAALQRPTAALAPAPSVFVRSRVMKAESPLVASRHDLFVCPACRGPLERADERLRCTWCEAMYPVQDGIYVFK